jgi:hypothetical protein
LCWERAFSVVAKAAANACHTGRSGLAGESEHGSPLCLLRVTANAEAQFDFRCGNTTVGSRSVSICHISMPSSVSLSRASWTQQPCHVRSLFRRLGEPAGVQERLVPRIGWWPGLALWHPAPAEWSACELSAAVWGMVHMPGRICEMHAALLACLKHSINQPQRDGWLGIARFR